MQNYETSKDESLDMVNEPAFSSYYTRPMIAGLRSHLQRKLQEEKNLQTLLRVESALSQNGEETFAERYSRMKEYVFSHFDQAFAEEMMKRNFLIDQPQPSNDDEFDDIDRMFEEAEASGECSNEEMTKMFNV